MGMAVFEPDGRAFEAKTQLDNQNHNEVLDLSSHE